MILFWKIRGRLAVKSKHKKGKAKNRNQIDWLAESLCANLKDNEWAERVQSEGQDLPDEEDQEYEEADYDE